MPPWRTPVMRYLTSLNGIALAIVSVACSDNKANPRNSVAFYSALSFASPTRPKAFCSTR